MAVDQLTTAFAGELLRPGDEGYDEARAVWNGMFDRHPALVARCTCTEDVAAAVSHARESGLTIAVRGGGHSASGFGTCDDGVVIDLSPMHAVEVDPATATCRAGGGTTWGQFDAATQEHGLAVTGGRFSTTGVAGLTLGSGSGWLERRCGLTADNLIAVEVVLADGRVVTASEQENADLFWAVRGGSGNFGIVTRFDLRLHQIGPIVYGGLMACHPDRAGDILHCFRELMPTAPDDLGAAIAFISAPPEPFVPEEARGMPMVGIVICWTGDHAEGERVIAPLREAAQPLIDLVQPMPYAAVQSMLDGGGPKGINAYMKAEFLDELTDEACDKLIRWGMSRPGPMVQLLVEPLGGAITRLDDDATALGRRDAMWCYHALSLWMEPDEETAAAHLAWAKDLAADLAPHCREGVYLNFTSDAGEDRVRSSYGDAKYARLQAIKAKYDPDNLFRLNQNIRPASAGSNGG